MEIWAAKITDRVNTVLIDYTRTLSGVKRKQPYFSASDEKKKYMYYTSSILGELLVRKHCADQVGISCSEVLFEKNTYGKPYTISQPQYHFNISHSGKWVVCAFDHKPIGVDVELIKPIDLAVMKRFYSDMEIAYVLKHPIAEQLGLFYKIWTLKESYLKALGIGIRVSLKSFSFCLESEDIQMSSNIDEGNWSFRLYHIDPDYELAVCKQGFQFSQQVKKVDENALLDFITESTNVIFKSNQ